MAASKRAQELAAELMRIEEHLPAPTPAPVQYHQPASSAFSGHYAPPPSRYGRAPSSRHYSGARTDKFKAWVKAQYDKNPRLYMVGGISVAVALVAVIGFAVYKKKKEESENK